MGDMVKALVYLLMTAAGCWILSEALEIAFGARTGLTLGLTAMFHLLMAVGIWGAYAGQRGRPGALSRAAAGLASLGFFLLTYPPIAVAQTPAVTIDEFMRTHALFGLAGFLATVGTMLFGVAVLRNNSYDPWIGIVLTVAPLIFAAMMLAGGPSSIAVTANIIESIALMALGVSALRTLRARPDPPT